MSATPVPMAQAAADAFNNTFHKVPAQVSMDWWQRIWRTAVNWARAQPPVSPWSGKPIERAELLGRIDTAIERITSGSCSMRVPAEGDDPDLVLADCKVLLKAPPLPAEPPRGLLMSMAMRYDHALGAPGFYDQFAQFGLGHGITHAQRLDGTLRTMRQLYEEVSGHGFYSPERDAWYVEQASAAPAAGRTLTHKDLQDEIHAQARKLIERAEQYGVVVTIESRRTPDAKPAQYVIETRPTRSVYDKKPQQPQTTTTEQA